MTELVEYRRPDAAAQLVAWADAAQAAFHLAESLVRTNVCPPTFRGKPQEATAVILLGAELGISPIASLRSMYEIRGVIGMYVRAQVALAQSRGHRIWTVSESPDAVTVAGHRAGDPEHVEEVTWTMARARQAGLVRRGRSGEPGQYETQPITMLWSRAAGDVARRIAADVLAGVPELDEPDTSAPVAPVEGQRVQRRQPQPRQVTEVELPVEVVESDPAPQESPQQPEPGAGPPFDTLPGGSPARDSNPEPSPLSGEPVRTRPVDTLPIEDPPDYVEEDVEPMLTPAQLRKLQVLFVEHGVRGSDARHEYLSRWLGRQIDSTNDVTVTEASEIIDRLERAASGE